MSVTGAAEILGVRRATLSHVTTGKASVSAEMALRLEKAFSVGMDLLLKMQVTMLLKPECMETRSRLSASSRITLGFSDVKWAGAAPIAIDPSASASGHEAAKVTKTM